MALNFPSSPSVGQVFTDSTSGNTYRWTGTYWKSYSTVNPATDFDVVNLKESPTGLTYMTARIILSAKPY